VCGRFVGITKIAISMPSLSQKLVSEFVGTFILVVTVCCAIMAASPLAALAIACSLMVGIYSLGDVSGANFNPAVTGGLFLSNMLGHAGLSDFDFKLFAMYKVVQLLAGFCAAVCAGSAFGYSLFGLSSASSITDIGDTSNVLDLSKAFPTLGSENGYTMFSKMLAEMFYTCMLVFTVLNTATNPTPAEKGNHYFGLAIGFVIMAGANGIGHVSGCSLNPAVSFGIAMGSIVFGSAEWGTALQNFVLYSLAQGIGCLIAAGLFYVVRSDALFARTRKFQSTKSKFQTPLASKCVAEFTGTFYLIFTVCLVCSDTAKPVLGVVGIASSLMVMIYSLGQVSGANFNPAVTLALGMRSVLAWGDAAAYWCAQLFGGLFAVGMAVAIESGNASGTGGYNLALVASTPKVGGVDIAGRGTWGQIIEAEFFFTFLLVFVVLNAAVANGPNNYFGLAIGMCVTVGGVAVGGISGGCFNPAVSFALGIGGFFAKGKGGGNAGFLVYWTAQLLAAAAAAGATKIVRGAQEDEEQEEEGTDAETELMAK
jgi:aquaporin Z